MLQDELDELNRQSKPKLRLPFLTDGEETVTYEKNGDWTVEFHEDVDEETVDGKPLVRAQFPENLPAPEERLGEATVRVGRSAPEPQATPVPSARISNRPKPIAVLEYQNQEGVQRYEMVRDDIKVGRGGEGRWPAWVIEGPADISREHFQIRRDSGTGRFFIKDLSKFGTTVNGTRIPEGIKRDNGEEVDTKAEFDLPDEATIGLADVLFISFRALR
jgi:predicted component of type VI protein secretion system